MYDHERALVERLKDQPFALVGFNYGDELEHIQNAVIKKNLTWRSFFGGRDQTVPKSYNVKGYPTIVIIDADGVIQSVGHEPNDELIDELLAEM